MKAIKRSFPKSRLRRSRMKSFSRKLVSENKLTTNDVIWPVFLVENDNINLQFYEGLVVGIELPDSITLKVEETEGVVKGQTAASSFKPAILSNGFKIMVPPHIENGTRIVISTTNFSYVEKAKN